MVNSSHVTENMRELEINEIDKDFPPHNPHLIPWSMEKKSTRRCKGVSMDVLNSHKRKGKRYVPMPGVFGFPSKLPRSNPPSDLGQYTEFVETRNNDGTKNDKVETAFLKGKYKEDVYIGNHTTVWGSWWKDHQWGYKCCQQVTRNSYCTRTAGVEVVESATDLMEANAASHPKRRRLARFVDIEVILAHNYGDVDAREAGLPPAEVIECGKETNPCFPQCPSSAAWVPQF